MRFRTINKGNGWYYLEKKTLFFWTKVIKTYANGDTEPLLVADINGGRKEARKYVDNLNKIVDVFTVN